MIEESRGEWEREQLNKREETSSEVKVAYERQLDLLNEQLDNWKRQSEDIKNFYESQS